MRLTFEPTTDTGTPHCTVRRIATVVLSVKLCSDGASLLDALVQSPLQHALATGRRAQSAEDEHGIGRNLCCEAQPPPLTVAQRARLH